MVKQDAIGIAKGYLEILKSKKYPLSGVWLFGSYASGKTHKYSDIDLAIVLDKADDLISVQADLFRLTWGYNTMIEPHLFLRNEFTEETIVYIVPGILLQQPIFH